MIKKLVPFIIMLLIALFAYREGIFSGETVLTSHDYNTSSVVWRQMGSEDSNAGGVWYRDYMAGWADQVLPYNIFWLTTKVFDPFTSLTMVYFLGTLLTGWFFYLFMRSYGLSIIASLFGGVSLMLSNHFLTVLLPGHSSKFMSFIWIPLVFLFLRKAVRENRWTHYIYAGFFLGLSLQGQFYEAVLFFIILAAFYWCYLILQKRNAGQSCVLFVKSHFSKIISHKIGFVVMLLMMCALCAQMFPHMSHLGSSVQQQSVSKSVSWDYATSWSLPPEEILDLVVPGVFGWKSGDPDMPYWGRMGKPSVPSGLKLNNENVGMIVAILGLLAFVILRRERGSEAGFWLGAVIVTLIFSLGRHLPVLYGPFYHLPFMDSIRNPNKILWLTMFAVSVLGAMGFNLLFEKTLREKYRAGIERFGRGLRLTVFILGGLTLLSLIVGPELRSLIVERTRNTTGAENVTGYIPVAFALATLFAAALWLVIRRLTSVKDSPRNVLTFAGVMILLAVLDLWLSGRHFIQFNARNSSIRYDGTFAVKVERGSLTGIGYHTEVLDPVVSFLQHEASSGNVRVFVIHNQITDFYSRHYFPYHGIPCVNLFSENRLPGRYPDFFNVTGYRGQSLPLTSLYSIGVTHILSLEPVKTTNLSFPLLKSTPLTTWPDKYHTGMVFRIYGLTNSLPRVGISSHWLNADTIDEARQKLGENLRVHSAYTPVIENAPKPDLKVLSSSNASARIVHNGQNKTVIELETDSPGMLVLRDAWHPDWRATVNGVRSPVYHTDILFRAVAIQSGKSTVVFEFVPSQALWGLYLAGCILFGVTALFDLRKVLLSKKRG